MEGSGGGGGGGGGGYDIGISASSSSTSGIGGNNNFGPGAVTSGGGFKLPPWAWLVFFALIVLGVIAFIIKGKS